MGIISSIRTTITVIIIIITIPVIIFIFNQDYTNGFPTQINLPSENNVSEIEKFIHQYTNEERIKSGLIILNPDFKLDIIAKKHSEDMANNDYYSHVNLMGQDPTDRAKQNSYNCVKNYGSYYTEGISENIASIGFDYWKNDKQFAKEFVDSWMDSPGHRDNILNSDYDKLGVGVSNSGDGWILATQNFC